MLRFWNVSFMATPRDNGYCVTFRTEAEARRCAEELLSDGVYHVDLWAT